ncbi:hypothetical protein GQ457_04G024630 [Hibiscus cannabinus]
MAPDSLLHQFDDLKFTAEEQDVVFANANAVTIPEDDPQLHSNLFMIRLTSEEVRSDILKRGPWVFNDDRFAILPLNPMLYIDEYFFTKMIIWVRILRIPIGLMSESLGRSLGACIGSVVGTDTRIIDGNMVEFLRVRISIDVTKPLRRCVALSGYGSKPRLWPLQYEKLPNFCHWCGFIGHLVADCPRQPYDPLIKFQYGDWLQVNMKARRDVPVQQKGCIRFHEEAGSSNSHSGFSSLGAGADVPSGATLIASATPFRSILVPASVASPLGVATATSLTAEEGIAAQTKATVGVHGVSHEAAAPVAIAPAFDAIEEWLVEDNDSDVQVTTDLPVKIPTKRSSGGSDPSKAKRARSITTSSVNKESRVLKARMSSSKISSAAVDKQPRRGN